MIERDIGKAQPFGERAADTILLDRRTGARDFGGAGRGCKSLVDRLALVCPSTLVTQPRRPYAAECSRDRPEPRLGIVDAQAEPVFRARGQHTVRLGNALKHRSEEHTSELQSLMRISYAVFCLEK